MTGPDPRHVRLHRWDAGSLFPGPGSWTSPVVAADFDVVSVIASWTAVTPSETWLEVAVRRDVDAPWLLVGRWAETDAQIRRTTVDGQRAGGARVHADEVRIDAAGAWRTAQVRVTPCRAPGSDEWPALTSVALCLSGRDVVACSEPSGGAAHVIDVPAYSQQLYRDQLPEYGAGGQNWCSPTSVAMVLAHWGVGPGDDPVPYTAAQTYDLSYGGTGNWAFNTAFAGRFGMAAYVTRLRSLREAEDFTRAGIPLVLSVAFRRDQLDGAGYDTDGHLLVLVGLDDRGDPVVNDPASHLLPDPAQVRTTYRRKQLERAWLGSSGGVVYVIHPPQVLLPRPPAEANWQ